MIAVAVAAVIAGVLIAVLSGGGRDLHGTGSRSGRAGGGDVTLAARYLGITPAQLRSRLRSGESLAQIAAATSGRSPAGLEQALAGQRIAEVKRSGLTPAQQSAAIERVRKRVKRELKHVRGRATTVTAARYLGISPERLAAELGTGHTLADVARATPGRSVAGLASALAASREHALAAALKAGQITPAAEQQAVRRVRAHVQREIKRRFAT